MSYLINPYKVSPAISYCANEGTLSVYFNAGAARTYIGTQITGTGFPWLNETTGSVSFYLKELSGATGDITCEQRNTGGVIATSSTTLDASTLTGDFLKYTFDFASDITLSNNTILGVKRTTGASTVYAQCWLNSNGGQDDCDINQGYDDPGEGAGNLNWCIKGD